MSMKTSQQAGASESQLGALRVCASRRSTDLREWPAGVLPAFSDVTCAGRLLARGAEIGRGISHETIRRVSLAPIDSDCVVLSKPGPVQDAARAVDETGELGGDSRCLLRHSRTD